jgi:hypothetical protein
MSILTFLAISVIGVFAFGFVCPRCRKGLVTKSASILGGLPCVCPKCGASMDDPQKIRDPE